jgi:hypothetical protein
MAIYLDEEWKIKMKFVQLQMEYPRNSNVPFESFPDIISNAQGNDPQVIDESIVIMNSFSEFEDLYKKAISSLTPIKSKEFWEDDVNKETTNDPCEANIANANKQEAIPYLMRPIIKEGEITTFRSWRGLGKTSIVKSVCASIISETQFIEDKWWTVPKSKDGIRKILYLDFESGSSEIGKKNFEIVELIWQRISDESKRKACRGNLIIKDLRDKGIKCTDENDHKKILKFLADAQKQGSNDRQVDLIVFDTYTAVVGPEAVNTFERFEPLLNKLQKMGIAIILVHHSNEDGSSRGFKNKEDKFYTEVNLHRKGNKIGTLNDEFWVTVKKNRGSAVSVDLEPFQIYLDEKKWKLFDPQITSLEEFGKIVSAYRYNRYYRNAIMEMLDIGKSTYHKYLNEYKKYLESQEKQTE